MATMMAHRYYSDDEPMNDGAAGSEQFCIDEEVHVSHGYSEYDQLGAEERYHSTSTWGHIRPCDGSCRRHKGQMYEHPLPPEVAEAAHRAVLEGFPAVKGWQLVVEGKGVNPDTGETLSLTRRSGIEA